MNIAVTGTSRGIGLELVRQLAATGPDTVVHAAARNPEASTALQTLAAASNGRVRIHQCDVSDPASVQRFGRELGSGSLDLLINNAGVDGGRQGWRDLTAEAAVEAFRVNALGPILVTRALLPALKRAERPRAVAITSGMGSIEQTEGGWYGYRMSKAALNMGIRSLAVELRRERIILAVLDPGWVRTDMGGRTAPLSADQSVRDLLRVIERLELKDTGSFLDRRGRVVPW